MLICHSWRFVFLHVPKCAGTVIRNTIYKEAPIGSATSLFDFQYSHKLRRHVDLAHLPLMDMRHYSEWRFLENYFSIATIRHPYARLLSACREYYRQKSRETEMQMRSAQPTKDQLLKYLRALPHALGSHDLRYVHGFPMVWFTHYGNIPMVDNILKCENLKEDIIELGQQNVVPMTLINKLLSETRAYCQLDPLSTGHALEGDLKALANIIYAEDFNTFEYEREDAQISDPQLKNTIEKTIYATQSHEIECISIAPTVRWYWGRNSNIFCPYMEKERDKKKLPEKGADCV